ncbi:THAP domain-containing protein 1-like [Ixodes scapularis]|uniref:THAP domain-containing protein 1-like n=1 Tax=Ixodes scapularis TaxID=6945 RepID=UPI001C38E9A4|nr:THAP domain-containing protein 1-like [Ixodes scapularis]
MTGCSVPLCAASSAKGVRCFRFPQEKARRRKWESCIKRDRWKASHTSRICERHFEEDQYEMNRQDGRRLLKRTAVPTLFDFRLQPKRRKPPAPRAPPADRGGATTAGPSSISAAEVSDQEDSGTEDTQPNPILEENVHDRLNDTVDIVTLHTSELQKTLQDTKRKNCELEESLSAAKKKLKRALRKTRQLETKLSTLTRNLTFLNEDQKREHALVLMKEYVQGEKHLTYVSLEVFNFVSCCEGVFKAFSEEEDICLLKSPMKTITRLIEQSVPVPRVECSKHPDLIRKLLERFVVMRLRIYLHWLSQPEESDDGYGSKTVAGTNLQ